MFQEVIPRPQVDGDTVLVEQIGMRVIPNALCTPATGSFVRLKLVECP